VLLTLDAGNVNVPLLLGLAFTCSRLRDESLLAKESPAIDRGTLSSSWGESFRAPNRAPASPVASDRQNVMEPISPELVLVDPDLATRVRAAPVERPRPALEGPLGHNASAEAAAPAAMGARPARTFQRLGALLLGTGLLVGGVLAASVVSGTNIELQAVSPPDGGEALAPEVVTRPATVGTVRRQRAAPAARTTVRAAPAARTTVRARPTAKPRRRADANRRSNVAPRRRRQTPARAAGAETRAAVERKLLTVIVQSPAGKLPKALIDGKTGLAKNNLQAVCTRNNDSRSFACVVTSALQPNAPPVRAHYRRTKSGRGAFTW
jgi:hypothetical protein